MEEENHFDRLPDCLLIVIFNKISEAKTLIQCCLVSKRFASLIRHIDTLLLRITLCFCKTSRLGLLMNFIPIFKFWMRTQNTCSPNHAPVSAVPDLLMNKFQEVKFMQMDLNICRINRINHILKSYPLKFKYKAVFGSHFEIFVVLSGNLMRHSVPATTSTPTQEGLYEGVGTAQEYNLTLLNIAALWHFVYLTIVSNQETRHQSLVVVDNLGMGKLCMGEEQLVRLRSCVTPFRYLESNGVVCCEKLWYVPVLNLPVSGYVMKDVSLAVIQPVDQPIEMERDVQVILGAFDEEEEGKVYDEAVIEILKDSNKKTFIREVTIN